MTRFCNSEASNVILLSRRRKTAWQTQAQKHLLVKGGREEEEGEDAVDDGVDGDDDDVDDDDVDDDVDGDVDDVDAVGGEVMAHPAGLFEKLRSKNPSSILHSSFNSPPTTAQSFTHWSSPTALQASSIIPQ